MIYVILSTIVVFLIILTEKNFFNWKMCIRKWDEKGLDKL